VINSYLRIFIESWELIDRLVCFVCVRGQNTRDHIIEVASDLFYSNGYNRTGINEIIEKADIAKATLYNHFNSKEDICVAYLDFMNKDLLEQITSFCNSKPKGKKRLLAILEYPLELYASKDFKGCWCIRTVAEVAHNEVRIRTKIKEQKDALLTFILNQVEENENQLSVKEQGILAKRIYLLYETAVSESYLQKSDWPIKESINMLKAIV